RHRLAGGHHGVIFPRIMQRRGGAAPGHQLVGLAGHRRNHHRHVMAGIHLALHMARDVADTIDVCDGRAAEFHHEAAHDDACIPLDKDKFRQLALKTGSAATERRVYIAARPGASGFLRGFWPEGYRLWRRSCRIGITEVKRMGRYIDDILQPGEKVLYSTNAHWIFFAPAILLWILAAALFLLSGLVPAGSPLIMVCWALAAIVALVALYKTVTAWFH